MKRTYVLIVVLMLVLLPVFARAGGTADKRLITVNGDAEVKVVPEEVLLVLGVETFDPDLSAAKGRNDGIMKEVLALARDKFGLRQNDLKTDYISVEPQYENKRVYREFLGYLVRKNVVLVMDDITKFEPLLTEALGAGVNYVHSIEFRTKETRKYKDQARALALKAAKEKATDMARELGLEIGKTQSIMESYSGWWSWYGSYWGGWGWRGGQTQNAVQTAGYGGMGEGGSLAPGLISVTARVTVSFELK